MAIRQAFSRYGYPAVLATLAAQSSWVISDGHKMHYPQLPDPNGWDVNVHDFTLADDGRYPCIALARQAWQQGGDSMAVLNAANEVAVAHFLEHQIRFTEIPKLINEVMERTTTGPADDLAAILDADARARQLATELVKVRA